MERALFLPLQMLMTLYLLAIGVVWWAITVSFLTKNKKLTKTSSYFTFSIALAFGFAFAFGVGIYNSNNEPVKM